MPRACARRSASPPRASPTCSTGPPSGCAAAARCSASRHASRCAMARSEPFNLRRHLLAGQVIPAHPLALTPTRTLDERHQRALTRYYVAAGAGGMAVGVHTTQFAIRRVGLLRPVLELAAETADAALASRAAPPGGGAPGAFA